MEFVLENRKVFNPCTYKQVEFMRSFDNFFTNPSNTTSQIIKRLSKETASEIIDVLRGGEEVVLKSNY